MRQSASARRRHSSREYDHLVPLFAELAALADDDPRRKTVRDQLVTGYLPLAEHIAHRFAGRGIPTEDLVQVATVGLINAVDRFQPEKGSDFLSYAVPTVMGEVRRHFRDASWAMRVPRRLTELHQSVSAASARLAQQLGRAPTPAEIATHLGLSTDEVYAGLDAGQAHHASSLDEPLGAGGEGMPLGEAIGEADSGIAGVENHQALEALLRELPRRERHIIALRFHHNLTQTQIAERVGLSQMQVSRLLRRTLATLRQRLLDTDTGDESAGTRKVPRP